MPDKLTIPELGKKVRYLLEKTVNGIHRQKTLENRLDKKAAFVCKLNDSIDQATFDLLCETYPDISVELWRTPTLKVFVTGLVKQGLVDDPLITLSGIDFDARERDMNRLRNWFETLQGHWELFSYSALNTPKTRYIHHGFLEVIHLKENGFIECAIKGQRYSYNGHCYPLNNTLYFLFEEINLKQEMLFMMMRLPSQDNRSGMNGVCSFPSAPSSIKMSLRQVNSLEELKKTYCITKDFNEVDAVLSDHIESCINQNNSLLSTAILDAIDNNVPIEAIPYALCADGKRHAPDLNETPDKIMSVLQDKLNALTEKMSSVQQDCIRDYCRLLQNALCSQTYYLVKPSHYRERLVTLAEESQKFIIATYWHDNYQHYANNAAATQISLAYLEAQARMIKERNISVQRIFISEAKQPDEVLLTRMRQEQNVGIEVYYLPADEWESLSWNLTSAIDFAVFDGKIALVLGDKDPYSWIPPASVTSNENELRNLIDLFRLNRGNASLWLP